MNTNETTVITSRTGDCELRVNSKDMERRRPAIIFDLDGTLCNNDHRQHLVQGEDKAWAEFFKKIPGDTPNKWCAELIRMVFCDDRYAVLFVTGRGEEHRELTERWLEDNGLYMFPLYMRPMGSKKPDYEVKKEIYLTDIRPNYSVLFAVDDRTQVVKMWREVGVTCLQCADGDF